MTTRANEGHTQEAQADPAEAAPSVLAELMPTAARLAALVLVGLALAAALAVEPLARSAELTVLAGAVTLGAWAGVLLDGLGLRRSTVRAALVWGGSAAAATALLGVSGGFGLGAAAVAVGVFVLVASFGLLLHFLGRVLQDRLAASALLVAAVALCAAAPLWLGPLAESLAERTVIVNTIVALSPLTYLAALADFDYLRATWFYEHSALGALRYEYPSVWLQSAFYALPLAAAVAVTAARRKLQHVSSRSH
jgi:hypothetical protein